jgi:hypothetical protein
MSVLRYVDAVAVGVCVGVVVDVKCQVALRADLEIGAVALVADRNRQFVKSGVSVERHVDAGTRAMGQLSAFGCAHGASPLM